VARRALVGEDLSAVLNVRREIYRSAILTLRVRINATKSNGEECDCE
jgi:hypothetical protein